jgi:hypothetical protein
MNFNYAKFARLHGQFDELQQTARSLTATALEARQQLRGAEAEFARCVSRTDDEAAIADPLKALDWPHELKQHAGLDPRAPSRLVALREGVIDLNSRRTAAHERAAAFGAWFSRVKKLAQDEGVFL